MGKTNFNGLFWTLAIVGVISLLAACSDGSLGDPDLETARQATDKYRDASVAIADGYVATENCVSSPEGAMGFHYVNPELARDPSLDVGKPEILLYIPTEEGVKLAGVEYSFGIGGPGDPIPDRPPPAPVMFGQTFNGPMEGHGPDGPPHYDLHLWVWEENPLVLLLRKKWLKSGVRF